LKSLTYSSQKTFILATLVSTIIGTFTTGLGLYERVGQKRKQQQTDSKQDVKIKELEEQIKKSEEQNKKKKGGDNKTVRPEAVEDSLGQSGPLIRREYERDFSRLGNRFAAGDCK
jgi:hypothetical protein